VTILCADLTHYVTLDAEDQEALKEWDGKLRFNPVTGAYFCEGRKIIYVHRFVMGRVAEIEDRQVCFINRDRLDCRKENLFVFDPATDPKDKKRKMRKKE
jgi:hypothetical protein